MPRSAKQRQEDEDAGRHGSGKQPRVYAKLKRESQERKAPPNDSASYARDKRDAMDRKYGKR